MLSRNPDSEVDAVLQTEMLDFGSFEGELLEWEAEADVLEPEDDRQFRLRLESIQREIASHTPHDNGEEWTTVEFQVPRLWHARWVKAPSVSRLVLIALAMGWLSMLDARCRVRLRYRLLRRGQARAAAAISVPAGYRSLR